MSSMPTYKLTYFDARGVAELVRLTFLAAGVEFEDVRIKSEDWLELKPNTPQGKLPILEVDGETIPQSRAIARYVAREYGLYGETNIDNTMVDVVVGTVQDLEVHILKFYDEKDREKKAALMKPFLAETMPRFLEIFTTMLGENDWFVAQKLTLADIAVFHVFDYIAEMLTDKNKHDIYVSSPSMKKHSDRVRSIPSINAWLDRRPNTEY